jgi:hypothetical protein
MEIFCRGLTGQFSDVRIISGPMWKPEVEENPVEETLLNGKKKKPHKIMKYPVKFAITLCSSMEKQQM